MGNKTLSRVKTMIYAGLAFLADGAREENLIELEANAKYLPVEYGSLNREEKINWLEKEFENKLNIYNLNKKEPIIALDVNGIPTIQKDEIKYKFENVENLKRFEEIPELSDKGKTIFYKTNCPGIGEVEASINIRYILNKEGDKE